MTAQTGDIIDILLATYNGEEFLEEQLESIVAQTHRDWRLIARDDGSADRTPEILQAFRRRYPDKVVVLEDGDGNLGLVQNFSRLMARSDAPYAAFCDQDDVWIPEKLELSLAKMRELEREHGAEVPLLVFTDLEVVDESLNVIDLSFWHYQHLNPDFAGVFGRLLTQNVVTGCASLMNGPLIKLACPIPPRASVHDWWAGLIACALGAIGFVRESTVRYRQHQKNVLGARNLSLKTVPALGARLLMNYAASRARILERFDQARALLERYTDQLNSSNKLVLESFVGLPYLTAFGRVRVASRNRMLPFGFLRSTVFLLLCFK